jgi:hypothetical protein
MSTQVRDLLDRLTGEPSAVDDYLTNRCAITDEDNRASHQPSCGQARACAQGLAGGRG